MKKITVIGAVVIMLVLAHWAQGGVSLIRNGSFENDGGISPITTEDAPQYWCDVNIPSDKFNGWVDSDWWTHSYNDIDGNSLTLSSEPFATFSVGDVATVSQQVYLTDVNEIIFDVKLDTISAAVPWDPNLRSAVLLIDGDVVWESNSIGSDVKGEYLNKIYTVEPNYKDANLHTLSLGIRANVDETSYIEYYAQWDFVKFDTHCGGFGYLPEDLNYDCYVDFLDFAMLAGWWLEQNPAYKYDLFEDGVVDEYDVMVFAEGWLDCSYWENWQDDNWYEVELPAGDIDDSGEVDLRDVSVLAGDWLVAADCSTRADINDDGVVNFRDFAVLAGQWQLKSWLYGLN